MKARHAILIGSAIASCLMADPVQAQVDVDIIFLIDTSGSMGFSLDGSDTSPPADQQRIHFVITALPAIRDLVENLDSPPVNLKRFAFAIFPGNGTELVSWLKGDTATSTDLRSWFVDDFTDIVNNQVTIRWNGTPIVSALNEANAKWASSTIPPERIIFLLTDGAQHGGAEPPPDLSTGPTIGVLGMGPTTASETGYDFLETITGSEMIRSIDTASDDVKTLTTQMVDAVFSALGLTTTVDPSVNVTSSSADTFDVEVSSYDRQLYFLTAWSEPRDRNKIGFTVEAPGALLTPQTVSGMDGVAYTEGATYLMYIVGSEFLAGHLGTWHLEIDGSPLPAGTSQITDYFVGGASDLVVQAVSAPPGRIPTGEALPFAYQVTASDTALSTVAMEVEIRKPVLSFGNWMAENTLTADELKRVKGMKFPGFVSDAFKKSNYLKTVKHVPAPQTTRQILTLLDDGLHGDESAGDASFGNALTDVSDPGLYTVHLRATGTTPSGAPFTRERTETRLVEPDIDGTWSSSQLTATLVDKTPAGPVYDLTFVPRDRFGNYLDPGHEDDIKVVVTAGGTPIGALEDNLQGGYVQRVQTDPKADHLAVDVSYKDQAFPVRRVSIGGCGLDIVLAGGYTAFDKKLPLDDGATISLAARKCITSNLRLKGEVALVPTRDNVDQSGVVSRVTAGVEYRVPAGGSIFPYAETGLGWTGFYGFSKNDNALSLEYGLGVEKILTGPYSLVVGARDLVLFDAFGQGTTHTAEFRVGLSIQLGR